MAVFTWEILNKRLHATEQQTILLSYSLALIYKQDPIKQRISNLMEPDQA